MTNDCPINGIAMWCNIFHSDGNDVKANRLPSERREWYEQRCAGEVFSYRQTSDGKLCYIFKIENPNGDIPSANYEISCHRSDGVRQTVTYLQVDCARDNFEVYLMRRET